MTTICQFLVFVSSEAGLVSETLLYSHKWLINLNLPSNHKNYILCLKQLQLHPKH